MENIKINYLNIQYLYNYDLDKWGMMRYAKQGDACFDVRAAIFDPITLYQGQKQLIPNGFKCAFNSDLVLHLYPRSGLSCKHQVIMLNAPGTIDSGYRGEVMTCLYNLNERPYTINPGDRIAQAKLEYIPKIQMQILNFLPDSERGEGSFGSSGS